METHPRAFPTCAGLDVSLILPLPTCPEWLKPQHQSVPSVLMPQVWLPQATVVQSEALPALDGEVRVVVVPSPSDPDLLSPQQNNAPSLVTAQL